MSSHLLVSQVRESLESLRGSMQAFAVREKKLNEEQRAKISYAEKRFKEENAAQSAQGSAILAQAATTAATERKAFLTRVEGRRQRIFQAQKTSRQKTIDRISNEEGRQKYAIQKGLLTTHRTREEGIRQAGETFTKVQDDLAANRSGFVALEERARRVFAGYHSFRLRLTRPSGVPETNIAPDEYALLEELRALQQRTESDLKRFGGFILPRLFRLLPIWLWLVLVVIINVVLVPILEHFGIHSLTARQAMIVGGCLAALGLIGYLVGLSQSSSLAHSIARALETARRLHNACLDKAQARHDRDIALLEVNSKKGIESLEAEWQKALEEAAVAREISPPQLEERGRILLALHEKSHPARLQKLERSHQAILSRLQAESDRNQEQIRNAHQSRLAQIKAEYEAEWRQLEADWKEQLRPIREAFASANQALADHPWGWDPRQPESWSPATAFLHATPFGRLEADLTLLSETRPADPRLCFSADPIVSIPLVLHYPVQGSLLLETHKTGDESAVGALNTIILRLLASSPVGKLAFTIMDPIKLGQNFSAVTHLADYEENLIGGRIWTQSSQIEERLGHLTEHMEKVIQMYLRNEYASIADYNVEAGNIAEKYHFVVIADFPANFSEIAMQRLLRIAASGARCGVYTLIHWDHRHAAPSPVFVEELRKSCICLQSEGNGFALSHPYLVGARVLLDAPPSPEVTSDFLRRVGDAHQHSNRVIVPFSHIAPPPGQMWTLDTTEELRIPIGRSGATKLQYLAIGKGTRQHALIAGKTGSGKSTLFHVIITNLALWCSPEQVEFYLVDFKKGVEFKGYALRRLPHARVVAIESDREFGLSVLQRLDDELKRRGDLFRQYNVQDLSGYKRAGGREPMARALLLIDEFQEFFMEDDRVSQAAAVLLDRIVRQGRAFGIHVLLGSQTLGGAYTLARTTIGQMVIRIALQCNEADAYLIMDENNAAPRLLSRPGEGIYNDMAGASEGNSPFQTVWMSEEERDAYLREIQDRALANPTAFPGPVVFEGNAPADVAENPLLRALLAQLPAQGPGTPRVWLGAPNSIKGPTEVALDPRSGNNLLIVGQREEAAVAMVALSLVALAAQYPVGSARFVVFESMAPGSPEQALLEQVVSVIPHQATLAKAGDLEILGTLVEEMQRRSDQDPGAFPATFLFIHELHKFKKLRQEDEYSLSSDDAGNPSSQLQKLLAEGPGSNIHVVATLDSYTNVTRYLGRKGLGEFEQRVLFQMSQNDASSLSDDPKAGSLGLHRALFFNQQAGTLETFRPYALPERKWLEEVREALARPRH